MRALDGQAGLGVGARAVDLAVVLDPEAVEGHPDRGRAQAGRGRQQLPPVLAGGQGHPGGRQRFELGPADVVGEDPQELRRLGVGGQLVHRVGAKAEPVGVAELVGLLQHPGDLVDRHGRVGDALGPAVAAHGGAAHHLDLEPEFGDHPGASICPRWWPVRRLCPRRTPTSSTRCGRAPRPWQMERQAGKSGRWVTRRVLVVNPAACPPVEPGQPPRQLDQRTGDLGLRLPAHRPVGRLAEAAAQIQLQPVGYRAQGSGQDRRCLVLQDATRRAVALHQRQRDPLIRLAMGAAGPAHHGGGDLLGRVPGPGVVPVHDPRSTPGRHQDVARDQVAVGHHQRHGLGRPGRDQRLDLGQQRQGGAQAPRPPTSSPLRTRGQLPPVGRTMGGPIPLINLCALATRDAEAVDRGQDAAELAGQPDRRRRPGGASVHPFMDPDQHRLGAQVGDLGNAGAGRHHRARAGQGHPGGQRRQFQAHRPLQRLHAAGMRIPVERLDREPAPAGRQPP